MKRAIQNLRRAYSGLNKYLNDAVDIYRALLRRYWTQAKDIEGPDWPPIWLARLFLATILLLVLATVVRVVSRFTDALVTVSLRALSGAQVPKLVWDSLRSYFDFAGQEASLPGQDLLSFWIVSGAVLLALSNAGFLGARIAWSLYGLATASFMYFDPGHTGWPLRVAVVTLLWGALSTLSFTSNLKLQINWKTLNSLIRLTEPSRKSIVETAEAAVLERGHETLSSYFDEEGHRSQKEIAQHLRISPDAANSLRAKYVPDSIRSGSKVSPRLRREALQRAAEPDADMKEIAKSIGVEAATLKRWLSKDQPDDNPEKAPRD